MIYKFDQLPLDLKQAVILQVQGQGKLSRLRHDSEVEVIENKITKIFLRAPPLRLEDPSIDTS